MVDNEKFESLYTCYHGELPPWSDGSPAKLIIRKVGSFLVSAGRENLRSFPVFPEGGASSEMLAFAV
jgi:hypothetical protein